MLWVLGLADQSAVRSARAIEMATALNHPFTMAYALFHTGSLLMWKGEPERAHEMAQELLELAEAHGFQIWASLGAILLGATQTALGRTEEGLAKIETGFKDYQGLTSPPVFYPHILGIRAVALAQAGRPTDGLALLDSALKDADESRLAQELAQLLLIQGELLMAVSPARAAESFRLVLAGAREGGLKLLALMAATRLVKLEMAEGKAPESGRQLAEIYDSFTEGFETADLHEARAVLDAWRASSG
jgi:tetratricopeptide (TPR) repeat protein